MPLLMNFQTNLTCLPKERKLYTKIELVIFINKEFYVMKSLADLGGREGRTPPPGRPNSFDFMQFSGKFGVFTPPLEGSRPPWK